MNSLGSLTARLHSILEPEDQVALLCASLSALDSHEREAAARVLADPPRNRRLRLSALRNLVKDRLGDELYALSADYVGDATETIALLWQPTRNANRAPTPGEVLEGLATFGPMRLLPAVQSWLDASDADGRHLIARLVTGSFRPPAARHVLQRAFEIAGVKYQASWHDVRRQDATQPDLFGPPETSGGGKITAALLYVHRPAARSAPLMCTVGIWCNGAMTPLCKLPVADLDKVISHHASAHATKRFGPTTQVEHSSETALLVDISYEGVAASRRHKAGLTLQAPKILGLSPLNDIDQVSSLDDLARQLPTFGLRD